MPERLWKRRLNNCSDTEKLINESEADKMKNPVRYHQKKKYGNYEAGRKSYAARDRNTFK
jgi:hypothetical protein